MRVIKLGIISAFVFFVILLLISLLIPSTVRISRAVNVNGSKEALYDKIAHKENWLQWNEMANEKIDIQILAREPDRIATSWKYNGQTILSDFRMEESANVTVLQWYFDFHLKWYPWEKIGSITFDKQFGPLMERSLNNLKKQVENAH